MGVFWGEPERVEIVFAPRVALVVRGRVWHESQQIDDLPDGSVRLTLHVCNDSALRSWVLGFGSAAKVVQPASLAHAVADECRQAAALY
jgi:predicted DNA-binding transcriptional regulator YafY